MTPQKKRKFKVIKKLGQFLVQETPLDELLDEKSTPSKLILSEKLVNLDTKSAEEEIYRCFHWNLNLILRHEMQIILESKFNFLMLELKQDLYRLQTENVKVNKPFVDDTFHQMNLKFNSLVVDSNTLIQTDFWKNSELPDVTRFLLECTKNMPDRKKLEDELRSNFKDRFYILVIKLQPIFKLKFKKIPSKNKKKEEEKERKYTSSTLEPRASSYFGDFIDQHVLSNTALSKLLRGRNSKENIDIDTFMDTLSDYKKKYKATEALYS